MYVPMLAPTWGVPMFVQISVVHQTQGVMWILVATRMQVAVVVLIWVVVLIK